VLDKIVHWSYVSSNAIRIQSYVDFEKENVCLVVDFKVFNFDWGKIYWVQSVDCDEFVWMFFGLL
jgi:hypothetical protein